jgi:hypothetical protein
MKHMLHKSCFDATFETRPHGAWPKIAVARRILVL